MLPELQKGSSIMPGKVNPVIPEVVTQVSAQVIGNDTAITVGGMQGHLELNVFVPLLARNLLESIRLLAAASRLFAEKCVDGIEANRENAERYAELTLSAATALNPYIGYDKATEIVNTAATTGRPLRDVARRPASMRRRWTRRSTIGRWRNRISSRSPTHHRGVGLTSAGIRGSERNLDLGCDPPPGRGVTSIRDRGEACQERLPA